MHFCVEGLDIVIVGGGIGGLTTAVALGRDGHRVTVLDQAVELRPTGAGISLWSNGVKVLNALGLGPAIAAVGGLLEGVTYLDRSGAPLCDFSLQPLVERVGQRPYPVRRSDLQTLLLDAAGRDDIRLGQRAVAVDDDGERATVTTATGDRFSGDLVVVADGTHSRLRDHVIGQAVPREYVGYHNWNGIVPDGLGKPDAWTVFLGEAKRVSTMPVRDGHYFFFDVPLEHPEIDATRAPKDVLADHFGWWAEPVRRLIDQLDESATANVSIHSHQPIDRFARGRVALLGDAAHTTAPDLGQGGCQAMEDALVLAHHLRTTNVSVADSLRRYSDERVPRTDAIVRRATERARLSHGHDLALTEAWYRELATEDGSNIIDGICKSIETGPCR